MSSDCARRPQPVHKRRQFRRILPVHVLENIRDSQNAFFIASQRNRVHRNSNSRAVRPFELETIIVNFISFQGLCNRAVVGGENLAVQRIKAARTAEELLAPSQQRHAAPQLYSSSVEPQDSTGRSDTDVNTSLHCFQQVFDIGPNRVRIHGHPAAQTICGVNSSV